MHSKKIFKLLVVLVIIFLGACKAKRCASFESQDNEYKLKYDRHGRVKK
jgi:hypothetical protein